VGTVTIESFAFVPIILRSTSACDILRIIEQMYMKFYSQVFYYSFSTHF
jgi:hypothetical protein